MQLAEKPKKVVCLIFCKPMKRRAKPGNCLLSSETLFLAEATYAASTSASACSADSLPPWSDNSDSKAEASGPCMAALGKAL